MEDYNSLFEIMQESGHIEWVLARRGGGNKSGTGNYRRCNQSLPRPSRSLKQSQANIVSEESHVELEKSDFQARSIKDSN